jgi:uncharacterized protein (TIGR03435 family)
MLLRKLAAIALTPAAGLLWSQPAREFDTVSIKPYEPKGPTFEGCNSHSDPGRLNLVGCALKGLIFRAYGLKTYQFPNVSAPWTENDRFVVEAHTTTPANQPEMMRMLQSVLADRFQLRVHWEDREAPVYLLRTAGRGAKLQPATNTAHCGEIDLQETTLKADCLTLDDLADALQESLVRDHPVLNQTGLDKDSRYRISLQFSLNDDPDVGPSIFAALPDQLGLTLKPGKAPVHTLVIDHAEKPSGN